MDISMVPLNTYHLTRFGIKPSSEQAKSYLSDGSVAYCLLLAGEPVFAGGIVNMQWHRGEAWMLPTPFFRNHVKTCYKFMSTVLPAMALSNKFRRVQATCAIAVSPSLFSHLGFIQEGILKSFGPNGESCYMYARLF